MKIKIFKTKQEREINEFIEEHDVMTDRIMYRKNEIILAYFDKEERVYGMSKDSILETLSGSLEKLQAQYMEVLEAVRYWKIKSGLKEGGKEEYKIELDQLKQHTNRADEAMAHVKVVRKLIEDAKNGELDLG